MPFEGLSEKLLRAGIAPRHVRRYRRELEDHLADLTEAQHEAGHDGQDAASRARALLGRDEELAAAMLTRPELKSWTARLPWLVFGLAPPLVMLAVIFAMSLPLVLTSALEGIMGNSGATAPQWFRDWAHATGGLANVGLGPALAVLLVLMARRQRMNWKWPLLGIAILAAAGFHMVTRFPPPGQHGGQIAITALEELSGWPFPSQGPLWGLHMLLTLAPALWLWRAQGFVRRTESR
jgi:hypothetical protein